LEQKKIFSTSYPFLIICPGSFTWLIRQNPTVYNAAKIISLLCLVLLNSQKVGFALSHWNAIFEIGFNPK
jgi:hypothetical protein